MKRDYPRVPGPGRTILVVLLILALLAVGADFGLKWWTERLIGNRVRSEMALDRRPDVHIDGFPFIAEVVKERIDRVEIRAANVTAEDLHLVSAELDLAGVRFRRSALFSGGDPDIRAERGEGRLRVSDQDLTAALQARDVPVEVRFLGPDIRARTRLSVGGEVVTAVARSELRLEEGGLVFEPTEVGVSGGTIGVPPAAVAFRVSLPSLLPGMRYRALQVADGTAEVVIRVPPVYVPI